MDQWTRQVRATRFFRAMLGPVFQRIMNFTCEKITLEGGYLLLSNHTTDYDPVFMGIAAGPLKYVASEHIMRKGLGTWFLKYFFDPITIEKGSMALRTTREMFHALKDGKPVCLFPEGNRCFNGVTGNIPAVTGKLVQMCGVPVVTYRLEGGYLTQPRWGTTLRRGRMKGSIVNIYMPEDLKKMKPDAITELIRRDLHVDTYEAKSERTAHRGKNPALGLETAIFSCPACRQFQTMESSSHALSCKCGFRLIYDEFGYLSGNSVKNTSSTASKCKNEASDNEITYTVTELDMLQREELASCVAAALRNSENPDSNLAREATPIFSDTVTAMEIGKDHSVVKEFSGLLEAYVDHVRFAGKDYPMDMIRGAAVHSRNGLTIHFGKDSVHYEIMGERFWNALKYLYLYRLVNQEELF